jgi:hypothetical protein
MKKGLGIVILGVAIGFAVMQGLASLPSAAFAVGSCPLAGQACQICNPACPSDPGACITGCTTPFGCSSGMGIPPCSPSLTPPPPTPPPPPPPPPAPTTPSGGACVVDQFGSTTGIGCCSDADCSKSGGDTHCQGPGLTGSFCTSSSKCDNSLSGQYYRGVQCCSDSDCGSPNYRKDDTHCQNPGLTDSYCTNPLVVPAGPINAGALQSQFSCMPNTQVTYPLNGEIITSCIAKQRQNNLPLHFNVCQGNETSGPCRPARIDQKAAVAAAAAMGPTCCALQETLGGGIDPTTGLTYFWDELCPAPGTSISTLIKGPGGMCIVNPNTPSGTVNPPIAATPATPGVTAASSSANASNAIGAVINSLEQSILRYRASTAAPAQTQNNTAIATAATSQTAATQTLLAALTSSLQSISSSLTTGSAGIGKSVLANVATLLDTMAQIIASLHLANAGDPTIALTVNGGDSAVINNGDTLTYSLHTTNADYVTSSFTGGSVVPVSGNAGPFCDYRNYLAYINPNFGGAKLPPEGWGLVNFQNGVAGGGFVTAPGSYSVGPLDVGPVTPLTVRKKSYYNGYNVSCLVDQVYTLTMTAVQAGTDKQASASVKVTIAGDIPLNNVWYLVAYLARPINNIPPYITDPNDPRKMMPNPDYHNENTDAANFDPIPSALNSSWFVRTPSSSMSSPITVPVTLFERPGVFVPIPTVTLMNTSALGVTYMGDDSAAQLAGQYSGYYSAFEIGKLQIVLPPNVSLPQKFMLKADGAGGTKYTTITVTSY